MTSFSPKHLLPLDARAEIEYTPFLPSSLHQLYDESEGSEFLDDAIRMHDQPLLHIEALISPEASAHIMYEPW